MPDNGGMDTPISRAIATLGGLSEFARTLGVSRQYAWQMKEGKRPVSRHLCPAIEVLTKAKGDRVPCSELRPDVDWAYLRGTAPAEKVA